ncbi:MAG: DegV family protein [Anaeroplasmataceae bacterium]
MSKYIILTDSTTDLSEEHRKKIDVEIVPLTYFVDGIEYKNYPDARELSRKDFYDKLRNKSISSTAQLNSEELISIYKPFLEKGLDLLIIGFSSGLSGTFNSIRLAVEDLKEQFPDRKIFAIDSLLASMGEGLLVHYAAKNKDNNMSIEENYDYIMKLRHNIKCWFTVSDIDFLKRGGRVTSVSAFVAKTVKINPILIVDEKGKLVPKIKKIGRRNAIKELVNQLLKCYDTKKPSTIFISHGDSLEDALYLKELVLNAVEVESIEINNIGPVIGSHSGPDTIALFFVDKANSL